MDINNRTLKQPIIRCFIEISGIVGHIKYVSIQESDSIKEDIGEIDDAIRKELFFEEGFMEKTITPIYLHIKDHFSKSDAKLFIRSLVEIGIKTLKKCYGSFLFYQEHGLLYYFRPSIQLYDTEIMPYLTEVYGSLHAYFDKCVIDDFCKSLVLYGCTIIKELPDTQIFGSDGYDITLN